MLIGVLWILFMEWAWAWRKGRSCIMMQSLEDSTRFTISESRLIELMHLRVGKLVVSDNSDKNRQRRQARAARHQEGPNNVITVCVFATKAVVVLTFLATLSFTNLNIRPSHTETLHLKKPNTQLQTPPSCPSTRPKRKPARTSLRPS